MRWALPGVSVNLQSGVRALAALSNLRFARGVFGGIISFELQEDLGRPDLRPGHWVAAPQIQKTGEP